MNLNQGFDWSKPFVPQVGLVYVRGCEVEGMLDDQGKLIEEGNMVSCKNCVYSYMAPLGVCKTVNNIKLVMGNNIKLVMGKNINCIK